MPRRVIADGNSCLECRRRKIKCDRSYPCSYCVRKKVDCAYPPPRESANTDSESSDILRRVERIEKRFMDLEQAVSEIKQFLQSWSPSVTAQGKNDNAPYNNNQHRQMEGIENDHKVQSESHSHIGSADLNVSSHNSTPVYGNAMVRQVLDDMPSNIPSTPLPTQDSRSLLLFESTKTAQLETLRPPSTMISFLWLKYLENVDRVLKIFHTPTVQKLVMEAMRSQGTLDAPSDCLLFSIYYSAVVGLSMSECRAEFGEERSVLLKRYRTGLECSLFRANFAEMPNMTVLQAFVIYLITGRRDEKGPDVHSLAGLAIGLAFKIDLHRDGEALGLSPFDVEMKRRLWWQICILDAHTAEEHGCDPCILESSFNTKLPSNIADSSLDPHMSSMPASKPGKTEMLFSLLQIEVGYFARQLLFSRSFVQQNSYMPMSGSEKCDAIDLFQKRIEEQYLSYCDTRIAFDFVTATFTRFILVKLKLAASRPEEEDEEDPRMKQNLREICIQILDYSNTIRSCENGQK